MATQDVANNPLGSYPVLVDKNTANAEMQVVRIDVGTGSAESRVTATNPLPVTVTGGGGGGGPIEDGVDSAIKATVFDYSNSNPVSVRLTDTNGDYVAASGGTQYTEGDTSASFIGTMAFTEGPANTATPLQVDASKHLQVDIAADSAGLATAANQSTGNTSLATIAGAVSGTEMQVDVLTMPSVTVTATDLDIRDLSSATDSVSAVQSGTWNVNNVSGTVSLPTGASTAARQDTGNTSLSSIDGKITACNTGAVVVSSSALPSGAATSANQTSEINLLTTIDADTSALATALGAGMSSAPTFKGLGVIPAGYNYIGSDSCEAGSTSTVLNLTSHAIRVNDIVFCFNGIAANQKAWSPVVSTTANTVTLQYALPTNPNTSDTILYMRPVPLAVSSTSTQTGGLIVNVDSDYQESAARGLLKLEDTSHSTGAAGVFVLGVRNDNGAVTFCSDGDYSPIAVDSAGRVGISDLAGSITVDNAGTFATQDSQTITDNTAFTDGTSKVFMAGYIYDESAGTALTENDAAAARINVNRAMVGTIEDGSTRGRYATVNKNGALHSMPFQSPPNIIPVSVQLSGTGSQQIIAAPASGIRIIVLSIIAANFDASTDDDILFKTSTTSIAYTYNKAKTTIQFTFPGGLRCNTAEAFNADPTAHGNWFISVTYYLYTD